MLLSRKLGQHALFFGGGKAVTVFSAQALRNEDAPTVTQFVVI